MAGVLAEGVSFSALLPLKWSPPAKGNRPTLPHQVNNIRWQWFRERAPLRRLAQLSYADKSRRTKSWVSRWCFNATKRGEETCGFLPRYFDRPLDLGERIAREGGSVVSRFDLWRALNGWRGGCAVSWRFGSLWLRYCGWSRVGRAWWGWIGKWIGVNWEDVLPYLRGFEIGFVMKEYKKKREIK